jgi:hypothetical protein
MNSIFIDAFTWSTDAWARKARAHDSHSEKNFGKPASALELVRSADVTGSPQHSTVLAQDPNQGDPRETSLYR